MAKFVTEFDLNKTVQDILEKANNLLILISPYIKLHERYLSVLKSKIDKPELFIIVVFGKNEEDKSKSFKPDDLKFFTEFPNIEIRYEKRLHAKFYANENTSLLTSMNLYSFSQDNNIEAGIVTKSSVFRDLTSGILPSVLSGNDFEEEAFNYFERVIEQADLLFSREPVYETGILGLQKKYVGSKINVDKIDSFFRNQNEFKSGKETKIVDGNQKFNKTHENSMGYCIRTGKRIPFNIQKPFSDEAYNSWAKFKNEEYPEKYCHYSGEPSNGETSFGKPIMKKNWKRFNESENYKPF